MAFQVSEDIVPAAVFKRQQSAMLRRIRESPRPLVITQYGRAAAVVISPSEYDRLMNAAEIREVLSRAEQDEAAGRLISHAEALRRFEGVLDRPGA